MPEIHLPLAGTRVLDLTRVLAGPFATRLLADLGADVVKVEEPGQGDPGRGAKGPAWAARGGSPMFLDFNRNKRSLALNLKAEEGRAVFRRLAATADVVVENFRPDVMEALGLGPEALREENPRLIYCSVSGFGRGAARSGARRLFWGSTPRRSCGRPAMVLRRSPVCGRAA